MSTVLKKGAPSRSYPSRQRKLGPAPFASFEDLSDELESPADGQHGSDYKVEVLPEIKEDMGQSPTPYAFDEEAIRGHKSVTATSSASTVTFAPSYSQPTSGPTSGLQTPSTPRIDISCASSSTPPSEDSASEKELFQGGLGFAFHEEGTEELRSSTEELDLGEVDIDSEEERRQKRHDKEKDDIYRRSSHPANIFRRRKSSNVVDNDDNQEDFHRKPSAHTLFLDGLLSRPCRHASFGSADYGSGRPGALSSMSAHSSGSMRGRSPSPHKMMLETSFCGSKPIPTKSMDMESPPKQDSPENETTKTTITTTVSSTTTKANTTSSLYMSNIIICNSSSSNSIKKPTALTEPSSPRTPPRSPKSPRDFERRPSSGRRSVSPFKMVYETSFCGNKPIPTKSMEQDSPPKELPDLTLGNFLASCSSKKASLTQVQVHQQQTTPSPTTHRAITPESPKSSDHWKQISPRVGTPSPTPGTSTACDRDSTRSDTRKFASSPSQESNKNLKLQTTNIFKWPEPVEQVEQDDRKNSPPVVAGNNKKPEPMKGCSSKSKNKDSSSTTKNVLENDERTTELKISEDPVVTVEDALPIESKGLFQPSDSFDEDGDLPYVPTTLPQEKPTVVPIFSSKERRSMSVTTTPVQRPKVNRPPNPASINDYIAYSSTTPKTIEGEPAKMKINLPKEDSLTDAGYTGLDNDIGATGGAGSGSGASRSGSTKSPRKKSGSITATSWTDFAEMGLRSPRDIRRKLREEENGAVVVDDGSSYHSESSDDVVVGQINACDDEGDALLKLPRVPFAMDLDVKSSQSSIHSQEELQHSPRSPSVSSTPYESSD